MGEKAVEPQCGLCYSFPMLNADYTGAASEVNHPESGEEGLRQPFTIRDICRADLKEELGFSDAEIARLDDAAMHRIARRLEDYFIDAGFWEGLEVYARYELEWQQNRQPKARE